MRFGTGFQQAELFPAEWVPSTQSVRVFMPFVLPGKQVSCDTPMIGPFVIASAEPKNKAPARGGLSGKIRTRAIGDSHSFSLESSSTSSPRHLFSPSSRPQQPTATIMSPPADGSMGKRESGTARILGSGASGVAELMVFHPVVSVHRSKRDCAD